MIIHRCKLFLFIIGHAPSQGRSSIKKIAKRAVTSDLWLLKKLFLSFKLAGNRRTHVLAVCSYPYHQSGCKEGLSIWQ